MHHMTEASHCHAVQGGAPAFSISEAEGAPVFTVPEQARAETAAHAVIHRGTKLLVCQKSKKNSHMSFEILNLGRDKVSYS